MSGLNFSKMLKKEIEKQSRKCRKKNISGQCYVKLDTTAEYFQSQLNVKKDSSFLTIRV